jgi:hypothetical protein
VLAALLVACGGIDTEDPGRVEGAARPRAALEAEAAAQRAAVGALTPGAEAPGQILFGDLHVHTSYSWDGLLFALPLVGGEGAHPPADACDFARYCAALDFYALTDHAESLTPAQWDLSKQSVRQCNAVAGDAGDPDLVAFMGFEWSQAGLTPETHWGHRCVVFPETAEEMLPLRPISSEDRSDRYLRLGGMMRQARWLQPHEWLTYGDAADQLGRLAAMPPCEAGADTRDLPADCREIALTPADLHARLDAWNLEALAIPHGTAWGVYTPATTSIDKHLDPAQFDPERQPLIEIMSGHGNSEEHRSFAAVEIEADGERACPEPSDDYLPCCWRAGEIMRSRCGDLPEKECESRVVEARHLAARSWITPWKVFPDAAPEEWLDCDQCRDCFKPSYNYRPRESVQYAMALSRDEDGRPLRFRYGFVASSDNHTARPGTGYKQIERHMMTDVVGTPSWLLRTATSLGARMDDPRRPEATDAERVRAIGNDMRVASFLYPGGLAAVHARGRSREAIWEALRRREAYGTSGPRILLWFDLLAADGAQHPMGSEVDLASAPRFEARAVGDFVQQPGCPDWTRDGLDAARVGRLCRDECRHPGEERHPIESIEVVRIRPQQVAGEAISPLIEDPWRSFPCEPDPAGCVVRFADDEFPSSGRDALYYVRALQEPTPAINGNPLEPRPDATGRVVVTRPCVGPGSEDGCPAPVAERAWSSPIFVNQGREGGPIAP